MRTSSKVRASGMGSPDGREDSMDQSIRPPQGCQPEGGERFSPHSPASSAPFGRSMLSVVRAPPGRGSGAAWSSERISLPASFTEPRTRSATSMSWNASLSAPGLKAPLPEAVLEPLRERLEARDVRMGPGPVPGLQELDVIEGLVELRLGERLQSSNDSLPQCLVHDSPPSPGLPSACSKRRGALLSWDSLSRTPKVSRSQWPGFPFAAFRCPTRPPGPTTPWLDGLGRSLDDPSTDRNELCRTVPDRAVLSRTP